MISKAEPWIYTLMLFLYCVGAIPNQFISPATAQPQDQKTYWFNVEPSGVATALHRFAEDSGLQVFYEQHLVHESRSPGVAGHYTPREALDRLLAGTGLTRKRDGSPGPHHLRVCVRNMYDEERIGDPGPLAVHIDDSISPLPSRAFHRS